MSKTILTEVNGFTPIIDSIASNKDLGIMGAAVFGRIWRYCQMSDNVCKASHDKIAEELGISRRTIIRYIEVLVSQGYLKDLTPELRNRPHIYADTGKASISIKVTATESHSEEIQCDRKSQPTVTESHSEEIQCDRKSQPTVTESHLKIVSKKEKDTCPSEWMNALYRICGIDPALASIGMRKQISEVGKALIKTSAAAQDLDRFAEWWVSDAWRRDNRPITPNIIRNEWAKFKAAKIKSENLTI